MSDYNFLKWAIIVLGLVQIVMCYLMLKVINWVRRLEWFLQENIRLGKRVVDHKVVDVDDKGGE